MENPKRGAYLACFGTTTGQSSRETCEKGTGAGAEIREGVWAGKGDHVRTPALPLGET